MLVTDAADDPIPLGTVDAHGGLAARHRVDAPAEGENWWFAVVCPPGTLDCGAGETYSAVTAPVWVRGAAAAAAVRPAAADVSADAAPSGADAAGAARSLPATGGTVQPVAALVVATASLALVALRRASTR